MKEAAWLCSRVATSVAAVWDSRSPPRISLTEFAWDRAAIDGDVNVTAEDNFYGRRRPAFRTMSTRGRPLAPSPT
jgi:hypothetical protein